MNDGSESPKAAPTGDAGLDTLCGGGFPRSGTTLVVGGLGTGKTVLSLQFLAHGWRHQGERGVYVGFEEPPAKLIENSASFSWGPDLHDGVSFIDAGDIIEEIYTGDFELFGLLAAIGEKISEIGATRLVLDAIDALLVMLGDERAIRREIYRLYRWVQEKRLTTVVTAKIVDDERDRRVVALDYMSDCVLKLSQDPSIKGGSREVSVLKMRGRPCFFGTFPFFIDASGIHALYPAFEAPTAKVAVGERLSTGISALDDMVSGGFFRGATTLITGLPGTGKTTLAARFAESVCKSGERCVYFSYEQAAPALIRDLRSVNVTLIDHVESGALSILGMLARSYTADFNMSEIIRALEKIEPTVVVIDSITAIADGGRGVLSSDAAMTIVEMLQAQGITSVVTALSQESGVEPVTLVGISAFSDNWVHLSNRVFGGERNRALSIIKARGTHQSNQVRELIFQSDGPDLAEVYVSGGDVLMGTARMERESAETQRERARHEASIAEVLSIEEEIEAMHADIARLNAGIVRRSAQLKVAVGRESDRKEGAIALREEIRRSRSENRD